MPTSTIRGLNISIDKDGLRAYLHVDPKQHHSRLELVMGPDGTMMGIFDDASAMVWKAP